MILMFPITQRDGKFCVQWKMEEIQIIGHKRKTRELMTRKKEKHRYRFDFFFFVFLQKWS